MRKPWPTLAALVLAPLMLQSPGVQAQEVTPADARVIVKFKEAASAMKAATASGSSTSTRHAQALAARTGLDLADGRSVGPRVQVVHGRGIASDALAARLSRDADVEYAVVDRRRHVAMVPNDPRFPGGLSGVTPAAGQWYLRAPDASIPAAVNAEGAWNRVTGAGVVVAVLDTGVRFNHPDLATKLLPGYDFVADVPTANDGNGRDSDASDPGDWVTQADTSNGFEDCTVESSSWHGTQVSGLIGAATNNGVGMAGLAGDVKILPVRVLGKCGGYDSDIIAGMNWAAGIAVDGVPANPNPARVLNMSLGGSGACGQAYADTISAVNALNVVVVVSAGNDGLAVSSPANCAGAIAVGGLRHAGTKVGYSSLGPDVALSAPAGNCVNTSGACLYPLLTTTNAGATMPTTNTYSDGNNISVGTSFAAPLVAGTAALLISADPTLTPAQVRSHLVASVRAFPSTGAEVGVSACQAPSATPQDSECYCTTSTCGAGMLDAQAAVQRVVAVAPVVPVISFNAANVTLSSAITLDSSKSVIPAGTTVSTEWSIVSGASLATITSATNAATVTLQGAGSAGDVVVRLTLTDTTSSESEFRDVTVRLGATQPSSPPLIVGDSGGGGGGALGLAWLAGLALAVIALQLQRNRLARAHSMQKVPRREV